MKTRIAFTLSALLMMSLTGCATQAQIEQQNRQLETISVSLKQIQANQQPGLELQRTQAALQAQGNALQTMQRQAGSR